MKHAHWIFLAVALVASPAAAADWFVAPTVQGNGSGSSAANACTLGTAMAGARAGDRVFLANGDYTNRRMLAPAQGGTPSQPIEIRGNPANPSAVVVRGFRVGNAVDYVWYRYLRVAGDLHVAAQNADSVMGIRMTNLTVTGSFFGRNPSRCLLDSCKIYPRQASGSSLVDNWFAFGFSDECPFGNYGYGTLPGGCSFDTVRACSIYVRQASTSGICSGGVTHMVKLCGQSDPPQQLNTLRLRNSLFRRNSFLIVKKAGAGQVRPVFLEGVLSNSLQDNHWDMRDSSGTQSEFNFRVKFKANYQSFLRDTFLMSGTSGMMQLSSQGNSDPRWTQGHNTWDGCFFKISSGNQGGGGYTGIDFWWGMNADTVRNSVIISRTTGGAPLALGATGTITGAQPDANGNDVAVPATSVLDHNTIICTTNNGNNDGATAWFMPAGISSGATLKVTNNIFVSTDATYPTRSGGAHYNFPSNSSLQCANNLYFSRAAPPTHSVIYQYAGGSKTYTKVGDPSLAWCASRGEDCSSRDALSLASIGFVDTTFTNFDARLLPTSVALFGPQGYVGAMGVTGPGPGPDVIRPASINTLGYDGLRIEGSRVRMTLQWEAVGDDGLLGTAAGYELRFSTAPIDETNFDSATLYADVPQPAPAGTRQALTVAAPEQATWWAIRAVDEAGNKGAPSAAIVVRRTPPVAGRPAPAVTAGAAAQLLSRGGR